MLVDSVSGEGQLSGLQMCLSGYSYLLEGVCVSYSALF